MTEKIFYEGRVTSAGHYAAPTRTFRLGRNCDFPQFITGTGFSFSKFLNKFEGKVVRLTLEVLDK